MKDFVLSDGVKFWIFYGAMILWMAWGLINSFSDYAFQIILGAVILFMGIWIIRREL